MSIFAVCQCGAPIEAPDDLAGQSVKCPQCAAAIALPTPAGIAKAPGLPGGNAQGGREQGEAKRQGIHRHSGKRGSAERGGGLRRGGLFRLAPQRDRHMHGEAEKQQQQGAQAPNHVTATRRASLATSGVSRAAEPQLWPAQAR